MTHHKQTQHGAKPRRRWWQWMAVGLMLLAIGTYVVTLDDSVVPEVRSNAGGTGAGPGR